MDEHVFEKIIHLQQCWQKREQDIEKKKLRKIKNKSKEENSSLTSFSLVIKSPFELFLSKFGEVDNGERGEILCQYDETVSFSCSDTGRSILNE